MQLQTVESSMIYGIGYDETTQTLETVFHSGKVYQYSQVPKEVYEQLMESGSIGGYMRDLIIDCYPCTQVRRNKQRR
ncbi:MAG TPA: KTSC domain-containing protein [Thermosynechococcaceae cyanobacterium]